MANSKAFPEFTVIFLIVASMLFQFTTAAGDNENAPLQPSTPLKTSEILHVQADRHKGLANYHRYKQISNGDRQSRVKHNHYFEEHATKAEETRKKARKVERVEKQLDTDTVAGKATPPLARTRGQVKKQKIAGGP